MTLAISTEQMWEAWERVQENAGCAGCDGVTVENFARRAERRIAQLLERVSAGTYRPFPLLEILVQKKPGSDATRRLLVPAVGDRVLQTAVARHLSRSFEEEFLECSTGTGRDDRWTGRLRGSGSAMSWDSGSSWMPILRPISTAWTTNSSYSGLRSGRSAGDAGAAAQLGESAGLERLENQSAAGRDSAGFSDFAAAR